VTIIGKKEEISRDFRRYITYYGVKDNNFTILKIIFKINNKKNYIHLALFTTSYNIHLWRVDLLCLQNYISSAFCSTSIDQRTKIHVSHPTYKVNLRWITHIINIVVWIVLLLDHSYKIMYPCQNTNIVKCFNSLGA